MFNRDVKEIKRIKLHLFDLKKRASLIELYDLYREYLDQYYSNSQLCKEVFDTINCPICNSSKSREELLLDQISYHRCESCECLYTPLMLKDEILTEMYASGVYQKYFQKLVNSSQKIRKEVLEQRKCEQLSSFFKSPGKLLDVACGSGSFLSTCKDAGWEVEGLDPSEGAAKIAKEKYEIAVHSEYFENFETSQKYNAVSVLGLEHLQEPWMAIQKAHDLLEDDGIFYFEGPSADCSLWEYLKQYPFAATRYIEAGRHYLFFSRTCIDKICDDIGFKIEFLETNGLDFETILLEKFELDVQEKILNMQDVLNGMLLGDHYRVFLRKVSKAGTV